MPKQYRIINISLVIFFVILIVLSVSATWYRYVVLGDFRYFLTEKDVPDRMDIRTY